MSILSFPERGHWGKSSWRGNCSGHVYKALFEQLKPKTFVDPMVGSGTSIEVAKEMGIEAYGFDLHSGFNVLQDSILERVGKPADLVISHPPYGGMIVYSGEVWGNPHPGDLSRCKDDEDFHEKLHVALMNQREATAGGGYFGTIIGDWRRNGQYTSYQAECIARMPKGELAAVLIKAQHNTLSDARQYPGMKLPRILHEYMVLWRKPARVLSYLGDLAELATQSRGRLDSAWRVIIKCALVSLGGEAGLDAIYSKVAENAPGKLNGNRHWQAKVRQILNQRQSEFMSAERGTWRLAA